MKNKPLENVKDQIGFCGIWCGSCAVGNGVLAELTKRYEEVINKYGLEGWAPKDFDFGEFKKGLSSIQSVPPCPGCLKGGGNQECKIRACASEKNITECIECDQPSECNNIEVLEKMRTGAKQAGLMVKTDDVDRQVLIDKWIEETKGKFPNMLLYLDDE